MDFGLDEYGNVIFRNAASGTELSWTFLPRTETKSRSYSVHWKTAELLKEHKDNADDLCNHFYNTIGMSQARFVMALKNKHDYGIPLRALWDGLFAAAISAKLSQVYSNMMEMYIDNRQLICIAASMRADKPNIGVAKAFALPERTFEDDVDSDSGFAPSTIAAAAAATGASPLA
jgi:hypothetical protein